MLLLANVSVLLMVVALPSDDAEYFSPYWDLNQIFCSKPAQLKFSKPM